MGCCSSKESPTSLLRRLRRKPFILGDPVQDRVDDRKECRVDNIDNTHVQVVVEVLVISDSADECGITVEGSLDGRPICVVECLRSVDGKQDAIAVDATGDEILRGREKVLKSRLLHVGQADTPRTTEQRRDDDTVDETGGVSRFDAGAHLRRTILIDPRV